MKNCITVNHSEKAFSIADLIALPPPDPSRLSPRVTARMFMHRDTIDVLIDGIPSGSVPQGSFRGSCVIDDPTIPPGIVVFRDPDTQKLIACLVDCGLRKLVREHNA